MGWIGVVTNEGKNLITNWNEGKVLKITSACAGTGTVETQALMAQTSLVSKVQDISITGDATDNKSNVRTIKLQITAFQQSYLLNQVGLYASINDEASVLMAIYQTDEGIPIPSKEESPGFGYSFYAKLAISNEGIIELNIDTSAYVTLESFLEHTNGSKAHTPSQVGAMGYVTITDDEINNIVLSSNLYMYRSYEGTANTPFEYALIAISHNAPGGQMAHYAFANDGKIYKRFLIRESASDGGGSYYTDWEEIKSESYSGNVGSLSYTEKVDLTNVAEILRDSYSNASITQNSVSGDDASFKINITGNVDFKAISNGRENDASIIVNGTQRYISADEAFEFTGIITSPIEVSTAMCTVTFEIFNINKDAITFDEMGDAEFCGQVYTTNKTSGNKEKLLTEKETNILSYSTPSTGLDIQNGVVLGIGTCRDENIIIPEIDSDGNVVCKVDDFVFGSLLGSDGGFIKRIVFPSSISLLGINVITSKYCPNLSAVFIMNPNIEWMDSQTFKLGENVKDVYLGFSRKRWIELNTVDNEHPLISLHDDNIAAGIVPTIHYSHFATSAEFENAIGDIDSALDELHSYAEALKSGGEA